jgi:CheY-like chemotaxis protein
MMESKINEMRINPDEVIRNHMESGKTLSILVSEDELINRKFLEVTIQKFGLSCDLAGDGRETLDKIRRNHYDIVLLDIQMPVMNGEEVLAALRDEGLTGHCFIIAQTAYTMKEEIDKYLSLGCRSFIAKPIDTDRLKMKIAEAILHMTGK